MTDDAADSAVYLRARSMDSAAILKKLRELGQERMDELHDTAMAVCYNRGACSALGIDYCGIRHDDVLRAFACVALAKGYIC